MQLLLSDKRWELVINVNEEAEETCCCLIVILSLAPWQSAKVMDELKMIRLGSLTVELVKRTDWLFAVGQVPSHRLIREAAYFCKRPQAISLIKLVSLRMFSTNICLLFLSDDRGEKVWTANKNANYEAQSTRFPLLSFVAVILKAANLNEIFAPDSQTRNTIFKLLLSFSWIQWPSL